MSATTWSGLAVSAVPMGLAFGMAMQNGLVILPETIRLQFTFSRCVSLPLPLPLPLPLRQLFSHHPSLRRHFLGCLVEGNIFRPSRIDN